MQWGENSVYLWVIRTITITNSGIPVLIFWVAAAAAASAWIPDICPGD
jgi:hypothetical protein